jgi:hypothetical protein
VLIGKAQGEQKTEVLLRRALAKLKLSDDAGGCRDLLDARDNASATSRFYRTLSTLIDSQLCKR